VANERLSIVERGASVPSASGDFSIGGEVWPGTSKVLEEMGELGQVLGKLIGSHGNINHFDGSNLEERLVEEIGDLMGAISFFMEANDLDRTAVFNRKIRKYNLFWEWHGTEARK
jgi:NTP pyrophosphatase (non-canonical NTP hydrolase)